MDPSNSGRIHVIDRHLCIRCGTCFEACIVRFDAACALTNRPVPTPISEDQRVIERKGKRAE